MSSLPPLDSKHLGQGVRARFIEGINGLRMHVLEAGHETKGRPLLLLLHGFPELAYSWRNVMAPLAEAGFHVVAPDQRGYGRTTGASDAYDQDLRPFFMLSLARDAVALSLALGYHKVAAVIGHDFGAAVTSWCALTRPDMFERCVIMSAPFGGPPSLPFGTANGDAHVAGLDRAGNDIDEGLAKLSRPRKHYQRYYTTREANDDMCRSPEGVGGFLRAYFHHKSADWTDNKPYRLKEWSAECLAEMPTYYVMNRDETMAETVRPHMPSATAVAANTWLSPAEMEVYAEEYGRTGFQASLNWYRARYVPHLNAELSLYSGKAIEVPSMFIAGKSDWGVYQVPGAFETMQTKAFSDMKGAHLVEGAGHWVQQEQSAKVVELLKAFLA
ncbi:MAG: alpha/beta fold hydrolase [Hyphomicrobiaceae bacterium]